MFASRWVAFAAIFSGCSEYDIVGASTDEEAPQEATDSAMPEEEVEQEFEGYGAVSGRICAPGEDSWVFGADVWVEVNGERFATTTDQDGAFVLDNVPAGDRTVQVQKGSFSTSFDVHIDVDEWVELATEECLQEDSARIGIVVGSFDTIQQMVGDLGFEYDLISDPTDLLRDPARMAEYDILFFNCGMDTGWSFYSDEVTANVRDYVSAGGSLYASDWAYDLVERSYPNMLEFVGEDGVLGSARVGASGTVAAQINDPAMMASLGSSNAEIQYDLSSWVVPTDVGDGVELMSGTTPLYFGGTTGAVLAARSQQGDGQVLFTTFHHEPQMNWHMDVLLREIVLSL